MPLVNAQCTNCGAVLKIDSNNEAAVCEHCGSAFVVEKAINNFNVTNNINVATLNVVGGNLDNYLALAENALDTNQSEEFNKYIEKAMEISPHSGKCWLLKLRYNEKYGIAIWDVLPFAKSMLKMVNDGNYEQQVYGLVIKKAKHTMDSFDRSLVYWIKEMHSERQTKDNMGNLDGNLEYVIALRQFIPTSYIAKDEYIQQEIKNLCLTYISVCEKLYRYTNRRQEPFNSISWRQDYNKKCVERLEILKEGLPSGLDNEISVQKIPKLPELPENSSACYVATCVYGSYDCPEVWTLRRFRDNTLDSTWYGRAFIKCYYAISPTIVRCFGDTAIFKSFWKKKLDIMVETLKASGVLDTPYDDKY